jgi:glutathione S-transferase
MSLKMAGIPFDEKLVRFGEPAFSREIKKLSAARRVPILIVKNNVIWDSLAILEYAAEVQPSLWPSNSVARHTARSVCAEMHSGFHALRNECPMSIRRTAKAVNISAACRADIKRIEQIWAECREKFGKSGPFLFGKFTNADAMYMPVAVRLLGFDIKVSKTSRAYITALIETHAFKAWKELALQEPWIVPHDEVD